MAEQEVIKHTKKIYKIWNSEEHSLWHKIKEFVLEIFIIVFAVTLSIWLHSWSEHRHQQEDVKGFLIGLKKDLTNDLKEMKSDRATFLLSKRAFLYVKKAKREKKVSDDSVRLYSPAFFNSTGLLPNNGRFEGFKSSGKIGTIEDLVLQNEIMDLYQENIPTLITFTDYYTENKRKFGDYYNQNFKTFDNGTNIKEILFADETQNFARDLVMVDSIVGQYDRCIANINRIIKTIDLNYSN